jgi:hypothetical protein
MKTVDASTIQRLVRDLGRRTRDWRAMLRFGNCLLKSVLGNIIKLITSLSHFLDSLLIMSFLRLVFQISSNICWLSGEVVVDLCDGHILNVGIELLLIWIRPTTLTNNLQLRVKLHPRIILDVKLPNIIQNFHLTVLFCSFACSNYHRVAS